MVAAVASLAAKIWRPPADTGTSPKIETMSMEWCSTYPKGGVDTKAAAAALVAESPTKSVLGVQGLHVSAVGTMTGNARGVEAGVVTGDLENAMTADAEAPRLTILDTSQCAFPVPEGPAFFRVSEPCCHVDPDLVQSDGCSGTYSCQPQLRQPVHPAVCHIYLTSVCESDTSRYNVLLPHLPRLRPCPSLGCL